MDDDSLPAPDMVAQLLAALATRPQAAQTMAQWLLDMERKAFISLLNNPKTQERIMGMMQNGKPVRN